MALIRETTVDPGPAEKALALLNRRLDEEIGRVEDDLLTGQGIEDFAQYRNILGRREGLLFASEALDEALKGDDADD